MYNKDTERFLQKRKKIVRNKNICLFFGGIIIAMLVFMDYENNLHAWTLLDFIIFFGISGILMQRRVYDLQDDIIETAKRRIK